MSGEGRAGEASLDGLEQDDARWRERLISENLGLAMYLARRFADRGEPLEDLRQAASLALVVAAQRYDPSLGHEFAPFATSTILGELKHHFRDRGWSVRAPRFLQELYLEVSQAMRELEQTLGRTPTTSELAATCGHTEREVAAAIAAGQGYRSTSIEGAEGTLDALCDRWVEERDGIEAVERRAELASHLRVLGVRDRTILRLRFVDELTQSEIAARLQLSQMQVSRLLARALDTLREAYRAGS